MFRLPSAKKIFHLTAALIFLFIQHNLLGQQDFVLYNMNVVPQRMYDNPAFKPTDSTIFIGIPLLSSQYFSFGNSGFKYSDLIKHRPDDSLYADVDNMLSKLASKNYIQLAYRTDILSFGFPIKKGYFSFNITEKANFRLSYTKDFMNFLWNGNGPYLGQDVHLNLGVDFTHYREYGFGYSRKVSDKLTVGGKLKYLYGMENISTKKSDVTLNTGTDDFAITAQSDVLINTSGLDSNSFKNFNPVAYLFKKKNRGAGIDMGAEYQYSDKLTFSASVIDLGFIRWTSAPTNYQSHTPGGAFTYRGVNLTELLNNDTLQLGDQFQHIGDSVSKTLKIDTVHHSYTTMLSTQIYLGANYSVTEKSNAAFLFYSQIFDKAIHPGFILSYNQQVGKWLSASASYSIYNRSYTNIGLGLALKAGATQWYIVSDDILGVLFPQNTKNIQVHFGLNLVWAHKKHHKEKKKAQI